MLARTLRVLHFQYFDASYEGYSYEAFAGVRVTDEEPGVVGPDGHSEWAAHEAHASPDPFCSSHGCSLLGRSCANDEQGLGALAWIAGCDAFESAVHARLYAGPWSVLRPVDLAEACVPLAFPEAADCERWTVDPSWLEVREVRQLDPQGR